jgi:hypothetical protein
MKLILTSLSQFSGAGVARLAVSMAMHERQLTRANVAAILICHCF